MTEEYIDAYCDVLDWKFLSSHSTLSKKSMMKHSDKLFWFAIANYQILDEELVMVGLKELKEVLRHDYS